MTAEKFEVSAPVVHPGSIAMQEDESLQKDGYRGVYVMQSEDALNVHDGDWQKKGKKIVTKTERILGDEIAVCLFLWLDELSRMLLSCPIGVSGICFSLALMNGHVLQWLCRLVGERDSSCTL